MNILQTIEAAAASQPRVDDPETIAKIGAPLREFVDTCPFLAFFDRKVSPMIFASDEVHLTTTGLRPDLANAPLDAWDRPDPADGTGSTGSPPVRSDKHLRSLKRSQGRESFEPKPVEVRAGVRVPLTLPKTVSFPDSLADSIANDLGFRFAAAVRAQYLGVLMSSAMQRRLVAPTPFAEAGDAARRLAEQTGGSVSILCNRRVGYQLFGAWPREDRLDDGTRLYKCDQLEDDVVLVVENAPDQVGFVRMVAEPQTIAYTDPTDLGNVTCATTARMAFGVWADSPIAGLQLVR